MESNTREDILVATKELLLKMIDANGVETEQIACVLFTTTPDLNAEFPAVAARELGWGNVALLCGHEMNPPHSLPHCLRVLILFNTSKPAKDIVHTYIKGAGKLRQGHPGDNFPKLGDRVC